MLGANCLSIGMVVGSLTLVLACTPFASTYLCRGWSSARFKGVDDKFFATPNGEEFWEPTITSLVSCQPTPPGCGHHRNSAIRINMFALLVSMCIRTATFIVGFRNSSVFRQYAVDKSHERIQAFLEVDALLYNLFRHVRRFDTSNPLRPTSDCCGCFPM